MRRLNWALWKVTADSLASLGIHEGDVRLFDHSPEATAAPKTGSVVLVHISDREDSEKSTTILRQYVHPDLIVTNRPGTNIAVRLDHPNFVGRVTGVMIEDDPEAEK